ncbi:dihydrofolate reductase [Aureibaculum algae]|uniref:Dihydrofolate reductase n=1 Tax=Aureibaculum algae TaxID=2584122 RepID=A0A5B7TRX7_9FLAO|nr:dihydrofolate reductase family protein [Aureibaculum algae]QCX39070.1 dihydrofolate reductase [Aureibaculum algae]
MQKIIYYVASSLDGFISGKNNDISQFIQKGEGVEKYQNDLLKFKVVIMGRKTYEFGFQYGLQAGQPVYPKMEHFIFSESMEIENMAPTVHVEEMSIDRVKKIKAHATSDIYLCGGGNFAGWLLDHGMIDQLKIKLNPIVLGEGVRLFGTSKSTNKWKLIETKSFKDGLVNLTYDKK